MAGIDHIKSLAYLLTALMPVAAGSAGAAAGTSEGATGTAVFDGYPQAPRFSVEPRQDQLQYYPCAQCHGFMEPNPNPRKLLSPHRNELHHGGGRIWCLTCHHETERNKLRDHLGAAIDFDQSFLVCGGCHADRQKDWYFGGHGKRKSGWSGERKLYNCTHCHDPHLPAIQPRAAEPPPPARVGFPSPRDHQHRTPPLWQRLENDAAPGSGH